MKVFFDTLKWPGSFIVESIPYHVFTVRAHPSNRNELTFYPFVQSLHFERPIRMIMKSMFNVHEDVYIF